MKKYILILDILTKKDPNVPKCNSLRDVMLCMFQVFDCVFCTLIFLSHHRQRGREGNKPWAGGLPLSPMSKQWQWQRRLPPSGCVDMEPHNACTVTRAPTLTQPCSRRCVHCWGLTRHEQHRFILNPTGQVERFNATRQKILATAAERCHWHWDVTIPYAVMAYQPNTAPQASHPTWWEITVPIGYWQLEHTSTVCPAAQRTTGALATAGMGGAGKICWAGQTTVRQKHLSGPTQSCRCSLVPDKRHQDGEKQGTEVLTFLRGPLFRCGTAGRLGLPDQKEPESKDQSSPPWQAQVLPFQGLAGH